MVNGTSQQTRRIEGFDGVQNRVVGPNSAAPKFQVDRFLESVTLRFNHQFLRALDECLSQLPEPDNESIRTLIEHMRNANNDGHNRDADCVFVDHEYQFSLLNGIYCVNTTHRFAQALAAHLATADCILPSAVFAAKKHLEEPNRLMGRYPAPREMSYGNRRAYPGGGY